MLRVSHAPRLISLGLVCSTLVLASCVADRQPQHMMPDQSSAVSMPGLCREPSPGKPYEYGCFLSASVALGTISDGPVFWHIYTFPSRSAAEANRDKDSTVIEAFGRTWLYAIANRGWQPSGGMRIAVVGPFELKPGIPYTARYMEATFPPGRKTSIHMHSGPEAWYVISGAQCLRTPDRTMIARAGEATFVPEGPPMVLSSIGSDTRRAIFVVLHDSSQPWQTNVGGWQPGRECEEASFRR